MEAVREEEVKLRGQDLWLAGYVVRSFVDIGNYTKRKCLNDVT